jgi:hypothetical protein
MVTFRSDIRDMCKNADAVSFRIVMASLAGSVPVVAMSMTRTAMVVGSHLTIAFARPEDRRSAGQCGLQFGEAFFDRAPGRVDNDAFAWPRVSAAAANLIP